MAEDVAEKQTGSEEPEAAEPARARRPYRKPVLRRIGSVRELTLGGTSGMPEGAGSFRAM